MEDYTYEDFRNDLENGFQIYFTYNHKRYLVYKTTENCYTQELITQEEKSPHARMNVITLKRLKEVYRFSKDFEYKV